MARLLILTAIINAAYSLNLDSLNFAPDGGERHGKEVQYVSTYANAIYQAYQFLVRDGNSGISDNNQTYYYTQPSPYKYGSTQWLWDSSAAIITNSNRDIDIAILELRTLLSAQQPDGRIPEMTDWPAGSSNQVSQMPTVVWALQVVYEKSKDKSMLKEFLPKVAAYHDWWRQTRDIDNNGLVTTIHPWESGLDASPAYDEPWHFEAQGDPVKDWLRLYPLFEELQTTYEKDYNWNVTEILARRIAPVSLRANWFVVQDVAMNVLYAAGWAVLGDLALELDDKKSATQYYAYNEFAETGIQRHMWNEDLKRFCTTYRDRDGRSKQTTVQGIQSLFALLLRSLTDEQRSALIGDVTNPNKFWTPYPFPTVSLMEPSYTPIYTTNLMWRGPAWGLTNWFVLKGLSVNGQTAIINEAVERWMNALRTGPGVWEMWNCEKGIGYGAEGLGMSTTFVDWLYRTGKVVPGVNDFSGILPNSPTQLWASEIVSGQITAAKMDAEQPPSEFDDSFWALTYGANAVIDRVELIEGETLVRGTPKTVEQISIFYGDKRSQDMFTGVHGSAGAGRTPTKMLRIDRTDFLLNVTVCVTTDDILSRVSYVSFVTAAGSTVEAGSQDGASCTELWAPESRRLLGLRGSVDRLGRISTLGVVGYF